MRVPSREPNSPSPANLPEALRLQFQALEGHLWRMETLAAVSGAACGLILSFALLFISDRLWNTPVVVRFLITISGAAVTLFFAWRWMRLWVWNRRDIRSLSTLVQKHYRRLGDRLLGIVELADPAKRPDNISHALCEAAIKQVSAEAKEFDFQRAVATRQPRNFALAFALLLLVAGAVCAVVPQAGWNSLLRWLLPASSLQRYTFVSLNALPEKMIVAHGEPFEIACSLEYRSFWHPTRASCQFERQPQIDASVYGREVVFHVPAQTRPGRLTLRIGDDSRRVLIEPTFRPELKQLSAHLQRPAYLQYPDEDVEIQNGLLAFLEGSRVSFHGKTSRPLSSASLVLPDKTSSLDLRSDGFQSGPLTLDGLPKCAFNWKDTLNLTNASPWVLTFAAQKDLAPQARCPNLAAVTAMLVDETLEIPCEAQDDYGVRELGLSWEVTNTRQAAAPPVRSDSRLKEGAPRNVKLDSVYRFSPRVLKIPEDSLVVLHATANDYFPDRPTAESYAYRIYVLGLDEHAQLVRKQLEELLSKIEELTQRQETLESTGEETKKLPDEKLAEEKAASELGEQSSDQSTYAEQLERLAKEAESILREGMRNSSMSGELLSEIAEQIQAMKDLAQSEMSKSAGGLKASQKNKERRREELEKALALQKKILEALREMQKAMNEGLDRMQARNLAQRLRKIAASETNISQTLRKTYPETIGQTLDKMSEKNQQITRNLASEQSTDHKEAGSAQDAIQKFFHKTQLARFDEVHKDMVQTKIVEEMSTGADLILQNKGGVMADTTFAWADRFTKWADKIDKQDPRKSQPKGGGQSRAMTEEEMQRMLEMIKNMTEVMRLREQEQQVRDQTTTLDQQKEKTPDYEKQAKELAERQRDIQKQLQELGKKPSMASFNQAMQKAAEAMGGAGQGLDKPETGKETVGDENKAIAALSELLEEMTASCGACGQCMGMGVMMQMMGMGKGEGSMGGGSTAGGDTSRPNAHLTGDPNGNAADPREVNRGTRKQESTLPSEYRDALQNYFNSVEQESP